ncbi:MAG: hypothetical protein R3D55_25575 [Chloroflexota bacterium]
MPIITEVMELSLVLLVAEYADILQNWGTEYAKLRAAARRGRVAASGAGQSGA